MTVQAIAKLVVLFLIVALPWMAIMTIGHLLIGLP
jgi:hypothetical protein